MVPSPLMQAFIRDLGARYNVNFETAPIGTHLKLRQPNYDPLVVERVGTYRISVAHYYEMNGDLVAEPDLVFLVRDGQWYAIECTQTLGYTNALDYNEQGEMRVRTYVQRDLAAFAESCAEDMRDAGWLEVVDDVTLEVPLP